MTTAPKDGTLVRLWLREDGRQFVGYYTDRWWAWIEHGIGAPSVTTDSKEAALEPASCSASRVAITDAG